jgi:hypothetical protein
MTLVLGVNCAVADVPSTPEVEIGPVVELAYLCRPSLRLHLRPDPFRNIHLTLKF